MYKKISYLMFLLVFLNFCSACATCVFVKESVLARNKKANNGIFNPVKFAGFKGYKGDGSFVEGPAYIGDIVGYSIGLLPAIFVSEPFRLIYRYSQTGDVVGEYTLYVTTKPFGCLFGAPSFLLKGVFHDFPIWVHSSIFGQPSAPEHHHVAEASTPVLATPPEVLAKFEKPEYPVITSISARPSMLPQKIQEAPKSEAPLEIKPVEADKTPWSTPPSVPDWAK